MTILKRPSIPMMLTIGLVVCAIRSFVNFVPFNGDLAGVTMQLFEIQRAVPPQPPPPPPLSIPLTKQSQTASPISKKRKQSMPSTARYKTHHPAKGSTIAAEKHTKALKTHTAVLVEEPRRSARGKKPSPFLFGTHSDTNTIENNTFPKARRVYTTNLLPGFKLNYPPLFPPGYGDVNAMRRVVLDIGANSGEEYTARAYKHGHSVLSFEPTPVVVQLFKRHMASDNVSLSVVSIPHKRVMPMAAADQPVQTGNRMRVLIPSRRVLEDGPHVYLFPFPISNHSRMLTFYKSPCKQGATCGKSNRVTENTDNRRGTSQIQSYRLDDLVLPVNPQSIWFMKIDVGGHELQVLQGARTLIHKSRVEYIGLEFSPNRRTGIKWGVDLLDELFTLGYACFHLRGFGKCHHEGVKSPSLNCNYPFSTVNEKLAPSFAEYTKVFEVQRGFEKARPRMADIMCKRKRQ